MKRLMAGLFAAVLVVAMLPGVAMAKADDTAVCKKGGWETLVTATGDTFKNQGQCVSYVAQGGTPRQMGPYEAACVSEGYVFAEKTTNPKFLYCETGLGFPQVETLARAIFWPICYDEEGGIFAYCNLHGRIACQLTT